MVTFGDYGLRVGMLSVADWYFWRYRGGCQISLGRVYLLLWWPKLA